MRLRRWWSAIALVALLTGLALHVRLYAFLCDDAYISFRYARNLAQGSGLVFNPGERVEGYTNFLWVLLLALGDALGVSPEHAALPLSLVATAACVAMVLWIARTRFGRGPDDPFVLVAVAFLALDRSFAVWSTSGLETRLFTVLVLGGAALLLPRWNAGASPGSDAAASRAPWARAALLLGLASWTRPEGLLLTACFALRPFVLAVRNRRIPVFLVRFVLPCLAMVGAHFAFRFLYYGELLPNTFHAKVTGLWPGMGMRYLGLFALETGLVLWLPLLVALAVRPPDAARARQLGRLGLPFLPYLVYLISIGGDHFEFRPLDVLLPVLALTLQEGAAALYARWRQFVGARRPLAARLLTFVHLIAVFLLLFVPGHAAHRAAADHYVPAEGIRTRETPGPWTAIPGLPAYLGAMDRLHAVLADRFIGLRQEEHVHALAGVREQAAFVLQAIDDGLIRRDEIISVGCAGAIPYLTGLVTIDMKGLTDAAVGKGRGSEITGDRMGHQRHATMDYLRERRVDYVFSQPCAAFFPRREYLDGDRFVRTRMAPWTFVVPWRERVFVFRTGIEEGEMGARLRERGFGFYLLRADGVLLDYTK